jgi:hypothetical protein
MIKIGCKNNLSALSVIEDYAKIELWFVIANKCGAATSTEELTTRDGLSNV